MAIHDRGIEPGSETDLAIERALEAAQLRAGDAQGTVTASVGDDREPSAAETGEATAAFDE